ncbi:MULTISPECIES: RHS repeat-associated core domain-containing protein [Cysteiniphilum]|uniref:Sugar-binding protein n=1 Tax=Cysteiniphilum litorale TaxID=2056700 RepID=A0A8J2Z4D9_9GAMM|nr:MULTISPECIES: RHS repeat-associated core domain-containing protein [Cysteiniphilum]GGF96703.1 sugar-binding protein [Cysteiniphilum litorale]
MFKFKISAIFLLLSPAYAQDLSLDAAKRINSNAKASITNAADNDDLLQQIATLGKLPEQQSVSGDEHSNLQEGENSKLVNKSLRSSSQSDDLVSDAFSFATLGRVDARTGTYDFNYVVGQTIDDTSLNQSFQLRLHYRQGNKLDSGFGIGWSLGLSFYDQNTQTLTLAGGFSQRIEYPSNKPQYYKLKDIKILPLSGDDLFKVVFKDGSYEIIGSNGRIKASFGVDGKKTSFYYNGGKLVQVQTGKNNIFISYEKNRVTIISRSNHGVERKVVINKTQDYLEDITYQAEQDYKTQFFYDNKGFIEKVIAPTGAAEEITYQRLLRPQGSGEVYAVDVHKVLPGYGQPTMQTRYQFGDQNSGNLNNYTGYPTASYVQGKDSLAEMNGKFNYSVKVITDSASTVYTYNKFHLLENSETFDSKGNLLTKEEKKYNFSPYATFDQLPNNYQYPISESTSYYNLKDNRANLQTKSSRLPLTVTSKYDDYGNLLETTDAYGIKKEIIYCESNSNSGGCVADPNGFKQYISKEIIYPQQGSHEYPQVKSYQYKHLSDQRNLIVADVVRSGYLKEGNINYISEKTFEYNDDINSDFFGMLRAEKTKDLTHNLSSQLKEINKTYAYAKESNGQLKQTSTLVSKSTEGADQSVSSKRILDGYTGQTLRAEDGVGNKVEMSYDLLGRLTKQVIAKGTEYEASTTNQYVYYSKNTELAFITTDAKGFQMKVQMDGLGREIAKYKQKVDANGHLITGQFVQLSKISYNAQGQVAEVIAYDTDVSGNIIEHKVSYVYDALGRNITTINPDGSQAHVLYDDVNNSKRQWLEKGNQKSRMTETIFDKVNNPIIERVISADDSKVLSEVRYFYDGFGRLIESEDISGNRTVTHYNEIGEADFVTLPTGDQTHKSYDMLGNLIEIGVKPKDQAKKVLGKRYFDDRGLLLWEENTEGVKETYQYDKTGNLIKMTNRYGYVVETEIDRVLQLPVKSYLTGDSDYDVFYDYDKVTGQLLTLTDNTGVKSYTYTAEGRLQKETYKPKNQNEVTAEYSYSRAGNVLSFKDYVGNVSQYHYDNMGKVIAVDYKYASEASFIKDYMTYHYDDLGRLQKKTIDGLTTMFSYDDKVNKTGFLISQIDKLSANDTTSINTLEYEFTTIKRNIDGQTYEFYTGNIAKKTRVDEANQKSIEGYFYDLMNNLADYQCLGSLCPKDQLGNTVLREEYTFDAFNNISKVKQTYVDKNTLVNGVNTTTYIYDQHNPAKLEKYTNSQSLYGNSQTIKYDIAGSIISDEQGNSLAYDKLGRMTSFTAKGARSGEEIRYGYNAQGEQIWQKVPNQEVLSLYYIGGVLSHESQYGQWLSYLSGNSMHGRIKQDSAKAITDIRYYIYDYAGSVLYDIEKSNNKLSVVSQKIYTPYGIASDLMSINSSGTEVLIDQFAIGYNGQRTEAVTGYQHLGNGYRAYNPMLKRFMAYDNMSPFDKGGINGYIYPNNPIAYADPIGHFWGWIAGAIGAIVGAIVGAVTGVIQGAITGDYNGVWKNAISGAAAGFVAGAMTDPTSMSAAAVVGVAALSTLAGSAAGFAVDLASGSSIKDAAITAGIGFAVGMVTFGVMKGAGAAVGRAAETSAGKAIGSAVGRVTRPITQAVSNFRSSVIKALTPKRMCFAAGTLVLTSISESGERSYKEIQEIELGDQVVTAIDSDIDVNINAPVIEWSGYSEPSQVDQSDNEYNDNVVMLSAETEIEEAA